jgi:hypothetical protein
MKWLGTAAIALTLLLVPISGIPGALAQPVDYDDASGSDGTCTSTGTANEQVTFCKDMREGNGQALSEPGYNPKPTPEPDPAPETETDTGTETTSDTRPRDETTDARDYSAVATATDQDADNLADDQEPGLGLDPSNADTDGDGVADGDEINIFGTDPLSADTDGDSASDGNELFWTMTDPLVPDAP